MSILLVLAAAFIGGVAAYLSGKRFTRGLQGHRAKTWVIVATVLLAVAAAAATQATQSLLDLGLAFTTVDVLEATNYFVFGFSGTAAWLLLKPSMLRWLLLALVPIALYEPLRWVFALVRWLVKRLGLW